MTKGWLTNDRRLGLWITVGVLALFGLRLGLAWLRQPRGIEHMIERFASVWAIQSAPSVAVSRAGDLIGIIRSTEIGVGVFVVDLSQNRETKLREVQDADYYTRARDARVWGWSPDDSLFAFTWADTKGGDILIFYNRTGTEQVSEVVLPYGLRSFAWLTSNSCVYIDNRTNLVLLRRSGVQWVELGNYSLAGGTGRPVPEPMSEEAVAISWVGGSELWQVDLTTGKIQKLYSCPDGSIIDVARYCAAKRAFLVSESVRRAPTSTLSVLSMSESGLAKRELARLPTIRDVQWINAGNGYACHVRQGEDNYVVVRPGTFHLDKIYFKRGDVAGIFIGSVTGSVYAIASISNEPPSIWLCSGDEPACVYRTWPVNVDLPPCQPTLIGYAPYDGHTARFDLVPPANFSRGKKYPLVIWLSGYTWWPVPHAVCAQALANAGAYVAFTRFTFGPNPGKLALDHIPIIEAVYEMMVANPNVDKRRVYICAFSGSTVAVCELLRRYPGRFRGVLLLHPGDLPEAIPGITSCVLVTAGADEGWLVRKLRDYQTDLCKVGMPVEFFMHQAGGHIARAQRTMRERTELLIKTVFE